MEKNQEGKYPAKVFPNREVSFVKIVIQVFYLPVTMRSRKN